MMAVLVPRWWSFFCLLVLEVLGNYVMDRARFGERRVEWISGTSRGRHWKCLAALDVCRLWRVLWRIVRDVWVGWRLVVLICMGWAFCWFFKVGINRDFIWAFPPDRYMRQRGFSSLITRCCFFVLFLFNAVLSISLKKIDNDMNAHISGRNLVLKLQKFASLLRSLLETYNFRLLYMRWTNLSYEIVTFKWLLNANCCEER